MVAKRISDEQARRELAIAVEIARENQKMWEEPESRATPDEAVEPPAGDAVRAERNRRFRRR